MEWTFHQPQFPFHFPSAWLGHMRFGYDLVRFMKPKRIVELGSHYGTSFFTFCQAAKDEGIDTVGYAVDTWKGDPLTGHYGEEVYESTKKTAMELYGPSAILVRAQFDNAVVFFQDNSIDLLHIDGLHSYEAVANDFAKWLPKLAKNGVVLLHDIKVVQEGFGVYKLWDEIKGQYPHFEFDHSFGLGVLFPKGVGEAFRDVLAAKQYMLSLYRE